MIQFVKSWRVGFLIFLSLQICPFEWNMQSKTLIKDPRHFQLGQPHISSYFRWLHAMRVGFPQLEAHFKCKFELPISSIGIR